MTDETNGSQGEPLTQEVKQETTVLTAPEVKTEAPAAEAFNWPDAWRDQIAAGDEKTRTRLERFKTPEDVWKHVRALETSQGELKKPLPENPTEEQVAQWRSENGIPESFDKYNIEGIAVGEQDKPIVDAFLQKMHEGNASNESVKQALGAYYDLVEQQRYAAIEANEAKKFATQEALKEEWGDNYQRNVNVISSALGKHGEDAKNAILSARDADGTLLANNPAVLKALAAMAMEANPLATVLPNEGTNAMDTLQGEIEKIEGMMADRQGPYWKGEKSGYYQNRYRELVETRTRIKK